jgi:hypothetical protein
MGATGANMAGQRFERNGPSGRFVAGHRNAPRQPVLARRRRPGALLGVLAASGLVVAACGGGSAAAPPPPPSTLSTVVPTTVTPTGQHDVSGNRVDLTEANEGAGVALPLGGTLTVTLPAATSGHGWRVVSHIAPELQEVSATPGIQLGTELLVFHGVHTGTVTLRLAGGPQQSFWAVVSVFTLHFTPQNFQPPRPGIRKGS